MFSFPSPGKIAILVTPDTYPKVQLAISNPTQWNAAWEDLYVSSPVLVHPNHILSMTRSVNRNRELAGVDKEKDKYANIVNYESTCEIQLRLGVKIMNAFTNDEFEHRWAVSTSASERREHVLKALANAGAQAKNLNLARAYCPDILRVDYLSTDGEVLLGLLREVVPQDVSVTPGEPYWISRCQEWKEVKERAFGRTSLQVAGEEERGDMMEVLVLRTKLIYLVLEGIVESFLGGSLPRVTVDKERDRRPKEVKIDDDRKLANEYKLLYGEAGHAKLREDLAALEERKSRRGVHCAKCQRIQREEEKFMRCKKCWDAIQRNVTYCGKNCQVADWKTRHKQICGKPLSSLDSMLAATRPRQGYLPPPPANQFPPPTNGFKRTPQLVMHIRLLDIAPQYDFILRINPQSHVQLFVPHAAIREIFRAARFKAFVHGDREAYVEMCHFLVWFVRATLADVRQSWDMRHAVDMMGKEFELPELRERMKECQDAQWRDELRRPPLVKSMEEEVWRRFLQEQGAIPGFSVFYLDRRMEDNELELMGLWVPTQAIWEDSSMAEEENR